ncbi:MAG: HIT family hydrolase, partial [Abditibacteriota bacterium]|nr:HIT family hydrolase [Abditibacteriota bacterium]
IGMNIGAVSGAGIADHLHMHIVPRWTGDINFMPVFADVRVIAESLEDTYAKMKPHFDEYGAKK